MERKSENHLPISPNVRTKDSHDKRFKLVIIFALIIVVFCTSFIVYGMTVDKFNDYDLPDSISITWYDYYKDSLKNTISSGNTVTEWPRWSAEYPYRSLFVGRSYGSASSSNLSLQYAFMVYSKKPTSNIFTFEYIDTGRKYPDSGRIRAIMKESDYVGSDDIAIRYSVVDSSSYDGVFNQVSFWNTFITTGNTDGYGNVVFEFDFYYECTAEHEKNVYPLNINGLRSITTVPYAYILHCGSHGSSGGSSSGSSSSGGSSGGGNGSYPYDPPYDGNDSLNRPDHELSVPDDWKDYTGGGSNPDKYPWEDDKNIPEDKFSIAPDPYDINGDYDGEHGDTWEIPEFDIPLKLPFTDKDLNIPPFPDTNWSNSGFDFVPDYPSGWPPSFPLS